MRLVSKFDIFDAKLTFDSCLMPFVGGNKIVLRTSTYNCIFSLDGNPIYGCSMRAGSISPTPDGYVIYIPYGWISGDKYLGEIYVHEKSEGGLSRLKGRLRAASRPAIGADGTMAFLVPDDNCHVLSVFDSNCTKKYSIDIGASVDDSLVFMYNEDVLAVGYPYRRRDNSIKLIINRHMTGELTPGHAVKHAWFCNKTCMALNRISMVSGRSRVGGTLVFLDGHKISKSIDIQDNILLCNTGDYALVIPKLHRNKLAVMTTLYPVTIYEVDSDIQSAHVNDNMLAIVTAEKIVYIFDTTLDNDTDRYISVAAVKSISD